MPTSPTCPNRDLWWHDPGPCPYCPLPCMTPGCALSRYHRRPHRDENLDELEVSSPTSTCTACGLHSTTHPNNGCVGVYGPAVEPTADDEIESLRATLRAIESLGCTVDAPWMCLAESDDWDELCGPCLAHAHLIGLLDTKHSS